jgi:hypothetical protein
VLSCALGEPVKSAANPLRCAHGLCPSSLFLATIPLLIGIAISYFIAKDFADGALLIHEKEVCAHRYVASKEAENATKRKCTGNEFPKCTDMEELDSVIARPDPDDRALWLMDIGCSDKATDIISFGEARAPPLPFSWADQFVTRVAIISAITLAVSLATYGLVRAIGWVIGGFAAS